jgi:hypothetical protein
LLLHQRIEHLRAERDGHPLAGVANPDLDDPFAASAAMVNVPPCDIASRALRTTLRNARPQLVAVHQERQVLGHLADQGDPGGSACGSKADSTSSASATCIGRAGRRGRTPADR